MGLEGLEQSVCDVDRHASFNVVAFHEEDRLTLLQKRDARRRRGVAGEHLSGAADGFGVLTRKNGGELFGLRLGMLHGECESGTGATRGATADGVDEDEGGALELLEFVLDFVAGLQFGESELSYFLSHRGDHGLVVHATPP